MQYLQIVFLEYAIGIVKYSGILYGTEGKKYFGLSAQLLNNNFSTMPTRQEMLSAIDCKIARTSQGNEGTGCFLPVMRQDVLDYIENEPDFRYLKEYKRLDIEADVFDKWQNEEEPLSSQDDDCVAYVFNLLP